MSAPGWYPDPAGQPHTFRYWDGQAWSAHTSQNPPPPPAPFSGGPSEATQVPGEQPVGGFTPQHGAPGQPTYNQGGQGWSTPPHPPTGQPSSGGRGKRVALIVLAVVLAIGLVVGGTFGVLALTGDSGEDSAAGDPTSEAATPDETDESPTEEPSTSESAAPAEPTGGECIGGTPGRGAETPTGSQVSGGGLSTPEISGFQPVPVESAFTFADGVATVARQIEENWIAVYAAGSLSKTSGFTTPEQAAETVLTCMVESADFYSGVSGRTDLDSTAIEVDGNDAWSLSAEIRVDDPQVTVEGDVARVVVVDTGQPDSFSLFVSVVPIGDQTLIDQQQDVVDRLVAQ